MNNTGRGNDGSTAALFNALDMADPSGHTSVVTDPRQLEALKQMDDLWRDGQQKQAQQRTNGNGSKHKQPKVSKYYSDRVEDDGDSDDSDDSGVGENE